MHWESDRHRADALAESFRLLAREKKPLAFGIVTNVSLAGEAGPSEAVQVFLEHKSGYCADVYFHYSLSEKRGVKIDHVSAEQGLPHLFSGGTVSY